MLFSIIEVKTYIGRLGQGVNMRKSSSTWSCEIITLEATVNDILYSQVHNKYNTCGQI